MKESNSESLQQFREIAANLTPQQIDDLKKDEPATGRMEPMHYGENPSPANETKKLDPKNESGQTEAARLADEYRRQQFAQKMKTDKTRLIANAGFEQVTYPSGVVGLRKKRNPQEEEKLRKIREELDLPANPNESEREDQRMQSWIEKRNEIDQIADAEGLGIEPKVKETIVGLNLLGYNTTQSCEGHSGPEQFSKPWIRVEAPNEPTYRFAGQENTFRQVAEKFNITLEAVQRAENMDAWKEAMNEAAQTGKSPEYIQWRMTNQELMTKLSSLLDEFYADRQAEPAIRLHIAENPDGGFEIHNGLKDYPSLPEDLTEEGRQEIIEKLAQCQVEIEVFTRFLRNKFFQ